MNNYKLVKKGLFESTSKFEERINSLTLEGWKAISISSDHHTLIVLMEKNKVV